MKPKLILIEQEKTIADLLAELKLEPDMYIVSVNGNMEEDTKTVLLSQQQVRIFSKISGGSDSSFFIIDKGNRIELGNGYTELEEETLAYNDTMAIKLARRMFIKELEPYAQPGFDIEALLDSTRCAECKKQLHLPEAWQHIPFKERKKYFKLLVTLGQTEILLCCSCYSNLND